MKFLHKNVSFWRRFASNLIDFFIFVSLIIGLWKILNFNSTNNEIKIASWYTFLIFSWLISLNLFVVIPFFWNYRSLGLILTRLQILIKTKKNKLVKCLIIYGFNFGFYSLIILIMLVGIQTSQIQNLYVQNISALNNLDLNLVFIARIISVLTGVWTLLILLNYALILATKKHSGLFEKIFSYRVVYIKHFNQNDKFNQIKLVPFKTKKVEIIFREVDND
ncbi:hypothetical protein EG856_00900 [Mycoplasmopsis phocirhinis]|uniref:RDD domain-containing protein n=1 Tax=Mycoplasmopsis phocirhinis TaxID=142650 RepID=A0A4P6MLY9_9BACT|nr:hypothetical protein [Mycoplasmopsis phocirhinis]QBF34488.1 hypothetical protein EG856_00900 [Mycoplasmopsis phocirhinis]